MVMLKPLADQVIVSTGASSGIGLATALRASGQEARVVLSSRNGDTPGKIVGDIRDKGDRAMHVVADVSKPDQLQRVAQSAIRASGGFDTWVNDAGTSLSAVVLG